MIETKNFNLQLFEGADNFDYRVINENFKIIDNTFGEDVTGKDLNSLNGSKFFYWNSGETQNCPFVYGYGLQIESYGREKTQIVFATGENHSCCVRKKTNNEWKPWEWSNPPMIEGVEYRTTQRYNSKVVYVKRINLGTLPSSGQKQVAYCTSGASEVVSFDICCTSDNAVRREMFPLYTGTGTLRAKVTCTLFNVFVNAFADSSDVTGIATVYYTKD